MSHKYISVADFRAPYDSVPFSGALGDHEDLVIREWPRRRSYQDVARFRQPYSNSGYFQDGSLMGLGALPPGQAGGTVTGPGATPAVDLNVLPEAFRRYLTTGEQMPTWRRDLGAALNQVPRWAWGVIAVLGLGGAWSGYRRWKKEQRGGSAQ